MTEQIAPHKLRMLYEQMELSLKTDKLEAFISGNVFPTLPDDEQARLNRQLSAMRDYREVLRERLVAFTA